MKRKYTILTLLAIGVAAFGATAALAQDAYRVGLSATLTGRGAGGYAPISEAINLYIDGVNARGGINGHPVKIIVEDNSASPSKAAAHAKKFISRDRVILMMNSSLSSTYAPMVKASARSGVPILFGGGVCPRETYPPAKALQFCSTSYAAMYDAEFAVDFIRSEASGPVRLGLASMAIPVSRGEVDYAEKLAPSRGMKAVSNQVIPPPTANYAPFATKIKESGANWVFSWAPWVTEFKTFNALRSLGWKGKFLTYGHINVESELSKIKDDGLYVMLANAYFSDDLPIHREIVAASKKKGTIHPPSFMAEGWIVGMTLEAILKQVSWPPSKEKVARAMQNVNVDTRGLRGGNLVWTADNHFRTRHYYRVYRWDSGKNAIVRVRNWTTVDVKPR